MPAALASRIVLTAAVFAGWFIQSAGAAGAPGSPSGASAAMRVYVDPQTGEPAPPPAAPPSEAAELAQPRSTDALAEEAAPAGGVIVHLQGRFASPLVVTVGSDGAAHVGHAPASGRPDAQ